MSPTLESVLAGFTAGSLFGIQMALHRVARELQRLRELGEREEKRAIPRFLS